MVSPKNRLAATPCLWRRYAEFASESYVCASRGNRLCVTLPLEPGEHSAQAKEQPPVDLPCRRKPKLLVVTPAPQGDWADAEHRAQLWARHENFRIRGRYNCRPPDRRRRRRLGSPRLAFCHPRPRNGATVREMVRSGWAPTPQGPSQKETRHRVPLCGQRDHTVRRKSPSQSSFSAPC